MKLICAFVFAYADCWFSHEAAQIYLGLRLYEKTGAVALLVACPICIEADQRRIYMYSFYEDFVTEIFLKAINSPQLIQKEHVPLNANQILESIARRLKMSDCPRHDFSF